MPRRKANYTAEAALAGSAQQSMLVEFSRRRIRQQRAKVILKDKRAFVLRVTVATGALVAGT
jgi:hypothetical protein